MQYWWCANQVQVGCRQPDRYPCPGSELGLTFVLNSSWLQITSAASGTGSYNLTYLILANTGSARSGAITIAGQTFFVTQTGISGCSTGSVSTNSTVNGSLGASSCRSLSRGSLYYAARYTFSGSAGQRIALALSSTNLDTYLYLYNPQGALLGEDDDSGGGLNSRIPGSGFFTLPSSGTYTIEATTFAPEDSGAFTPSLTVDGGTPPPPPPPTTALRFIPVTPCRVADTRAGSGAFGAPTPTAGSVRSFPIPQSACNIPPTAKAYSLNITVVPGVSLGYITVWPTGEPQPLASTLNSSHGGILANAAIVPAGTGGAVSVFVTDRTDLIIDINGYFDDTPSAQALDFFTLAPCRVVDTRDGSKPALLGPPFLAAGVTRSFPFLSGQCNIPTSARAYSLNSTVVPKSPLAYLSLWPTGVAQPVVSTLNAFEGNIVANMAIVPAGNGGSISAFATHATEVLFDVNGYFGPPASNGLKFYRASPCRVADTRAGEGPIMTGNSTRSFAVAGRCGIPTSAQAYSMNVTVVPSGSLQYLTLWPTGSAQPIVSTLNSNEGCILANGAIVPAGTNGSVMVYVTNNSHVILDINGYFAP